MKVNEINRYRKKDAYSYSFGSFPTLELMRIRPEMAEMILVHSDVKKRNSRKFASGMRKGGCGNHTKRPTCGKNT